MAAIQSIRNHGAWLIGAIGLALFAFIAEEFFRSLETGSAMSKQQAGSVYGKSISIQEYQQYVEEATEAFKVQQDIDNLSEQQQQQIREQVWQTYVQNCVIEHEADKLGLIVTEEEIQNALVNSSAQCLQQKPFINPQTGRFDFTGLQNFMKSYNEAKKNGTMSGEQMEASETMNRIWEHTYRQLRAELLQRKYALLLFSAMGSNPVAGKQFFEYASNSATAVVASIPAANISDKEAKATDDDIKDVYAQYKELLYNEQETRDLKIINVKVEASAADRKALDEKMNEYYQRIVAGEDLATITAIANSEIRYVNAPLTSAAFPYDVRSMLDSLSVGGTKAPAYSASDNTMNILHLVSKQQLPDSVLYRIIGVQAENEAATTKRADSIANAIKGGASFRTIAEKYGQRGDSLWVTSKRLEQGQIDESTAKYITALNTIGAGSTDIVSIDEAKFIVQVLERKNFVTKYNLAVVKVARDFSKETYNAELNKFNRFIAANRTIEDIEKNAGKNGYTVREVANVNCSTHTVANIEGTKDAVRWIFDEAKAGSVSKLYECGEAKDNLLLIAVTDIHKKGHRNWDEKAIKETLEPLANANVKSAKAFEKLNGVKTIEEAQKKGAVVDTVASIAFLGTPYMPSAGTAEPVICGALAKMKAGDVRTIKGANGAYVVKLVNVEKNEGIKYDAKEAQTQSAQANQQIIRNWLNALIRKADIEDTRYKF